MTTSESRLSVSNLAWPVTEDEAVATLLLDHGASGVEIAPGKVWPESPAVPEHDAAKYAQFWRTHGLQIVAFQAILFGRPQLSLFAEGADPRDFHAHMVAMGELAAATSARVLVLGAPANRRRGPLPFEAALRQAAVILRPIAQDLAQYDVRLCIEPNPPRYGCDFITTAAEAVLLSEAVDQPNFGIHLDAAALILSGETTGKALRNVLPHVHHFHISDIDLAPLGTTDAAPHAQLGRTLRDGGYRGWFSIEMLEGKSETWNTALPRAIAFAREHYCG